ncbi:MAG: hypothetical protein ACLTUP_08415, partial [Anaerotignum sp.]|uniref:hypothetical protein n=1 Tax=Anaerotignum sp. TaxID=2039241 RepID=UPI00399692B6
ITYSKTAEEQGFSNPALLMVSKESTPCRQSLISFKTLTSKQKYKAEAPSAKSFETSAFPRQK